MPRRRVAAKREILPDPKFGSEVLTRFINVVMLHGKKSVAEKIVYGALETATERLKKAHTEKKHEGSDGGGDASGGEGSGSGTRALTLDIFQTILDNVRPAVEVRSRRVGGATYQVPVEVRGNRGMALAMRWLVQAARGRGEKGMQNQLASEFCEAYENRGTAVKKREETHRMAKANQAFAHFRWT